jgi:hypothetical protein
VDWKKGICAAFIENTRKKVNPPSLWVGGLYVGTGMPVPMWAGYSFSSPGLYERFGRALRTVVIA